MADIEKFDPSKMMDGVRDRIKATFVSLIPDAHWETLVKAEVDRFFEKRHPENYNHTKYSDFQMLVQETLKAECKARLVEFLSSAEFNGVYA